MSTIEIEIQHLLNELGDTELVADELIRRWERNIYDPRQQFVLAQFLLHCGFYPSLFDQLHRLVTQERRLPWAQFAEALGRCRVAPSEAELKAMVEGLNEQEAMDEILLSIQTERWDKLFVKKRSERRNRIKLEYAAKKATLLEKLEFMRSQRLYEEEGRVMTELQALFPLDSQIQKVEEDYQDRWAREVVARNISSNTDVTDELASRLNELTPEQKSIKEIFARQAYEKAKDQVTKNPETAYDMALLLSFMDFYTEAIEVLNLATSEVRVDWLKLELLLKARQFLTALEEAGRLEIAYAGDPESTFSVVYARARALWGLGQGDLAIELMQSLVKIRPNYKSAQSLLADWTGGDF